MELEELTSRVRGGAGAFIENEDCSPLQVVAALRIVAAELEYMFLMAEFEDMEHECEK